LKSKRPKGRPKVRWKVDVQNDKSKMGTVNWKQVVKERDGWRTATGERLILLGQWSHSRIRIRIMRKRRRRH
jgi:hypothetical protein